MAKKNLPPLMKASELAKVDFITTGIPELDSIIKPKGSKDKGGFPVGRVSEIYGMEGVGKTSLTLQSIAGMQKAGKKVLFIDVENALNPQRAEEFGVDLEELSVSNESLQEVVANLIVEYVNKFDAIVVDSIAALVPNDELEGEAGAAFMGLKARGMGQLMRKVVKPVADSRCALIFINQERMNLDPYGKKTYTPGGKAVPFASSIRIELKTLSRDKIETTKAGVKSRSGHYITATVVKSKVSTPYETARFKLLY